MPQIFKPSSNKLAHFGLIGFIAMLFLMAIAGHAYFQSSYYNDVGVLREQPVPFSHKQHIQGLGLDCRFCHSAVEKSKTAGMPSTEVCMSCHSQILNNSDRLRVLRTSLSENRPIIWNRVHVLPDHVFFNHSIHVNKGVSCQSCHGNVQEMSQTSKVKPLTMKWCLECHAHPENNLVPINQVFSIEKLVNTKADFIQQNNLMKIYRIDRSRITNCYECHR
ncbi:MAG: cytochrome c3 family protein [Bacteriovorax sp.]|nr:cytochrome c3 family protein [Bacteriovorax sp.]